jgi:flagellar hook-length control protein FliK
MTGAAGIGSTAAAPPAGAKAKRADGAPVEAAKAETGEFAAFAELFSYIESEDVPGAKAKPDEDKPKRAEDDDDKTPAVLLAEMTHLQWFGGHLQMPAAEASASPSDGAARTTADTGPNLSADPAVVKAALNFDLPKPVREFVAKSVETRTNQTAASAAAMAAAAAQPAPAATPTPEEIAPPLQTPTLTVAPDPAATTTAATSAAPAIAKAAESAPAPVQTPRQPAPDPRLREPQSADAKASLLALETVLSRNGSTGKDTQDQSTGRPFTPPPPFREMRITALHQETHFAPSQTPVFQIASRIDQDLRSGGAEALQSPPAADAAQPAAPVRVLHIQLDPPQLGPLTVRISLKDDALNLQLETARHETAALIQTDKDALSGLLRSAGYKLDGLNVQVAAPDRTPQQQQFLGGGAAGGFGQASGQGAGSRQSDGRPGGRVAAAGGQVDGSAGSGHDRQGPQADKPRGGSVYL